MGVAIEIDNVVKKYGNNTVINGLSLDINPGEFFTLLGPSGCGKTTLLRMIIGFNSIEGGEIRVDGKVINKIPTNLRNMGMVFQNYAVFPHMSVEENVAFGLKTRKMPKTEIAKLVDDILDVVKIREYRDRMPDALSGGQQQRVALARAIVIHPQVLLMDEPLSNLDAKLRIEMRNAIKRIQQQIGITTVYVTHDQEEALAVSDRIAVMNGGVIQQTGTPQEIYQRPSNTFVANFIGLSNILPATTYVEGGVQGVDFGGYKVPMTNLQKVEQGAAVVVSVRPEEFFISTEGDEGLDAVVRTSIFLGVSTHYFVEMPNGEEMEIIRPSETGMLIPNNTPVKLQVDASKINVFTENGEVSLIAKAGA
ncbi:MAG: ABC transporter ATP-binding protein [Phascolarctobacterium sp.]|nr:ABC transporter ATP-binding protein [Phascolarctobacterium sp.]